MTSFLSYGARDALVEAIRLPGVPGVAPHPRQSVAAIAGLLRACWTTDPPFPVGDPPSVLVLALDGVGWDLAATVFTPDLLIPLTSVFPSTSGPAWLSAVTGLPVGAHRVPGVMWRAACGDRLYDSFSDESPPVPQPPVLFTALAAGGVRCVVNQGELATWPAHWRARLCAGADVLTPAADWDRIRDDPSAMADAAIAEIARGAAARPGPAGLLSWSWINADDHIHRHGWTGELRDALKRLDTAARAAADRGAHRAGVR